VGVDSSAVGSKAPTSSCLDHGSYTGRYRSTNVHAGIRLDFRFTKIPMIIREVSSICVNILGSGAEVRHELSLNEKTLTGGSGSLQHGCQVTCLRGSQTL